MPSETSKHSMQDNQAMIDKELMDRNLALEAVRVTEAAALAASKLVGRGDEKAADKAAVDAMRDALNSLAIEGRVVIGEGERDEAPMLYIGEEVGAGGPEVDIALDPLEGTTITAKGGQNALAVMAITDKDGFLHAPDTYMEKMAVGHGIPEDVLDLDAPLEDVLKKIAKAKSSSVEDLLVCVLDRPRHEDIINQVRAAGARITLIPDGDVSAVIATNEPETGIDFYVGTGGAPEGVLAAAALQCVGGSMLGRLVFRNDDEKARADKWGIKDYNKIYPSVLMADAVMSYVSEKGVLRVDFLGSDIEAISRVWRKLGAKKLHYIYMNKSIKFPF